MSLPLGIIEGFYGKPWSWEEREETIDFLAQHGFGFYLYAPKADIHLRRLWREPHPEDIAEKLVRVRRRCAEHGVRFGVGLSPTKLHLDFGTAAKEAFARKLAFFDELQVDDVALLFDDMRGDTPDLAERQAAIVHWAAERLNADRVIMCPSYYTDDPVLDRVFGQRPPSYLEHLGRMLDPSVQVFWTGPEVCSREISNGHVKRVSERLQRKLFLWDNYPVNDGERMSQYLYVRGFTGRSPGLRPHVVAHGINPALQPTLSRIPLLTLTQVYRQGADYDYGVATFDAAIAVLGRDLGRMVFEDMLTLQDVGLDRLDARAGVLYERYKDIDHPAAREIIAWLNGEYRITDAIVQAQAGEE